MYPYAATDADMLPTQDKRGLLSYAVCCLRSLVLRCHSCLEVFAIHKRYLVGE